MKKIIAITAAALFSIAGAAPVSAVVGDDDEVTIEDCAEADNGQPEECFDEDGNPLEPEDDGTYPIVGPEGGTVPVPETTVPATVPPTGLPKTGSSGTSGILQIGAIMLTGGLLLFVAARRRSTATA